MNKYIIALALMLGIVFTGHVSAQLTTVGTDAEKAKIEAAKTADEAAVKAKAASDEAATKAEDADKAAKTADEKAAMDKDAKKDGTKDRAIQSCGQAATENEGDEE